MSAREVIIDTIGTALVIAALLSLGGCGQEKAPETLVAIREVCAVTLNADGTIACTCEEKAP